MKSKRSFQISYLIVGVLAFAYVLYRVSKVGVTYDEVWTIDEFVSQDMMSIINYTPCDANNHILNTLLIKLFYALGPHTLFIARLPNVLVFLVYIFFSYKISSKYLSDFLGICLFLLLLLNPFVLDFFGLARGYGLSLGFLLGSIYYLMIYLSDKIPNKLLPSLVLAAIAVLCNFSLLNYFLALFFIVNLISLSFPQEYNFKRALITSFAVLVPLVLVIYEPIRKLMQSGKLYYGGDNNFYSDTLVSLAKYTLYNPKSTATSTYSLNAFLFTLLISVLLSFRFDRKILSLKNLVLGITVLCVLAVILQHYLFGTFYLLDRTAIFFYPLFIMCLCFTLNEIRIKGYSKIIALIVVCSFGVNFFAHANFYKTAIWFFDAHSESILSDIDKQGKLASRKMKIDFSWPFQSSIHYYADKNQYPFVEIIKNKEDREDLNSEADFYIYLGQSLEIVGYEASVQKINEIAKDTFKQYKNESILILNELRR